MKLVVAEAALAELHDAAAFYASQATAQLGLAFVAEFERSAKLLMSQPGIGTPVGGTRRRHVLRRFPYSVIYQVCDETLYVLAVARHRRRPGYWAKRS